jgi:SAM-dependent methyltransferase
MSLWTEDARTVATYDVECAGRADHGFYLALAAELGAAAVADLGCGTGVLAVDLARAGHRVTGVDPSQAMIDAARGRPDGGLVTWLRGSAAELPGGSLDLVVMTGHVAQYFVDDADWAAALTEVRRALRPGGRVAFESRVPGRGWRRRWTPDGTRASYPHPDGGEFTSWAEIVDFSGTADSFRMTHRGHTLLPDGSHLRFDETLRFRSEAELRESLAAAGFAVESYWGDWARGEPTETSDEQIIVARTPSVTPR